MTDEQPQPTPTEADATTNDAQSTEAPLKRRPLTDEEEAYHKELAAALKEKDRQPLNQLADIIQLCGIDFAKTIYQKTLETEAAGGLTISNGKRRRTIGGVFFYHARGTLPTNIRRFIFGAPQRKPRNMPELPSFDGTAYAAIYADLIQHPGSIDEFQITLEGPPGEPTFDGDRVIVAVQHAKGTPTLPRKVPKLPPDMPTTIVMMSRADWEGTRPIFQKKPDDWLVVGGVTVRTTLGDSEQSVLFAQQVSTREMQRQARIAARAEARREQAERDKAAPPVKPPRPEKKDKPARPARPDRSFTVAAPEPAIQVNLPDGVSDADRKKLIEMHTAANQLRQRVEAIKAQPPDKQIGLSMTERLLARTDKQIADIEKKYR